MSAPDLLVAARGPAGAAGGRLVVAPSIGLRAPRRTTPRPSLRLARPPGLGICGWLIAAYVSLLPVQIGGLATDFRIAPSDAFIPAYLVLRGARLRWRRSDWTAWHAAVIVALAGGALVSELRGELIVGALGTKVGGFLILCLTVLCLLDFASSLDRLRWLLRLLCGWTAVHTVVFLFILALQNRGLFPASDLNVGGARLAGLLIDPNAFGGLLVVALVLAVWLPRSLALFSPRMTAVVALVLATGLLFTFSRSAWIGLTFTFACLFATQPRRLVAIVVRALPLVLAGGLVVAATAASNVQSLAGRGDTASGRVTIIEESIGDLMTSPVVGVGLQGAYVLHGRIVHNTTLWFLTEFGVFGLVAIIGLLGSAAVRALAARRALPPPEGALPLALLGAHAGMFGVSMGIEALYQRHWWLVMAGITVCYGRARALVPAAAPSPLRAGRRAAAGRDRREPVARRTAADERLRPPPIPAGLLGPLHGNPPATAPADRTPATAAADRTPVTAQIDGTPAATEPTMPAAAVASSPAGLEPFFPAAAANGRAGASLVRAAARGRHTVIPARTPAGATARLHESLDGPAAAAVEEAPDDLRTAPSGPIRRRVAALRRERSREAISHGIWGLVDQAASSGTTFLLTVVVASSVDAQDFGAFSFVTVLWIVAIGAWRSLNTEPFMIRNAARPDEVRAAARRSLGCTWLAGLAFGVAMIATAEWVASPYRSPMQVLGVALPFLLLQDTGRVIGFTMFRTVTSAVSELAWAGLLTLALGGLVLFGPPTTPMWTYLAAWAAAGVVASALILQQLHLLPDLGVVTHDTVENLRMGAPLLLNYLLTGAPTYVLLLVTPAVASLAELGLLRAAYVPYGPFGVLLQGMQLVALPYAMKGDSPAKVIGLAYRLSIALAVAGVLWGAVVMFVVPDGLGTWLLGDLWVSSETTRALFAVATVGDALATGPLLALRALRAPGRLVRIRLWAGPLTFILGLSLLPVLGAEGAGIAIVIGFAATLALAVAHLRRIAAEGVTDPPEAADRLQGSPA